MMINRKKYIYKTYLRDVNKYQYNFFEDKDNNCYISIKKILEIKKPFCTAQGGCLIDNNYYIIEILYPNKHYTIRIFLNDRKEEILNYYDIIDKIKMDTRIMIPYYEDLYLDVIVNPELRLFLNIL